MFLRFVGLALITMTLASCALLGGTKKPPLDDYEMVPVPGGRFEMGDVFEGSNPDAVPVHPVDVKPFLIGRTEVTYGHYDAFAVATDRRLPDDQGKGRGSRAVTDVTWDEAMAFCATYGFRLPSEPEWEYAARSGGKRERFAGTSSDEERDDYVRHVDNSLSSATYVGTKRPNGLGLYDMSGNVFEWVGDYYQFYPQPDSSVVWSDFEVSDMRIVRGGSYRNAPAHAQTFWRSGTLREVRSEMIGFRCAADAP
ncbi:MAG: SUMF1/EgtB/PvdO family nonheme iron enzyme [Rhodothermales bacterium]|nr:SUMF1/EgtB/PvdO family nonheme iron enzyme [Rhodothermales bacterium]